MTQSPDRQNLITSILRKATRPSTLAIGGSLVAMGYVVYLGGKAFIKENIPSWVEPILSKTLNREVKIGTVQALSLNHLELGPISIPPTSTDPDTISIEKIAVDFNIVPLLLKRTLPAKVTVKEVKGYIEQDQAGNWVNIQLAEGGDPPPINLEINIDLKDAEIGLLPLGKIEPVEIIAEGEAAYLKNKNQQIKYDINAALNSGKINAKGETILDSFKTDAEVTIQELAIGDVVSLLPNSPVTINSGKVNANLDVNIVSLEEITATNIEGAVTLLDVEGNVQELSLPIQAKALLSFKEKDVLIEEAIAKLGAIVAVAEGVINWEKGYALAAKIEPFEVKNVLEIAQQNLPVNVDGKMQLNMQVTGPIKEPLLTGKLESLTPIIVDKVKFSQINSVFIGDLSQFQLKNATASFASGGEVTAKGTIDLNLQQSLEKNQPINVMGFPLNFDIQGEIPVGEIASVYGIQAETPSRLTTTGKVTGNLENLQGFLNWQIPSIILAGENFSGDGEVLLKGKNIILNNTELATATGKINVEGSTNFESQNWQVYVDGKDFPLAPFVSQIQLAQVEIPENINLETADIRLIGNTYALEPEKIQGRANLGLNIAEGIVLVNGELNNGIVNAEARANEIPVSQIVKAIPVPVSLVGSKLNLTANLEDLLAFQSTQDLSKLQLTADALLTAATGTVEVTGNLNNNQLQSEINANNLAIAQLLNPYLGEEKLDWNEELDAKIKLSGNINNLAAIPIQAEQVTVELGEQKLQTTGTLLLTDVLTQPDVTQVDLAIKANANLATLPVEEALAVLPFQQKTLLPKEVKLTGLVDLNNGRLTWQNLLIDPLAPGNLVLTGNLELEDFSLNNVEFQPLAGTVKIAPDSEMAINLRGEEDAIVANLEPCTRNDCLSPYLPGEIEFRKTQDPEIIVLGEREGEVFQAEVKNFPLGILGLAPASEFGIPGVLKGDVLANVNVNLFNLEGKGDLQVIKPGLGNIELDKIEAEFALKDNLAELPTAALTFGSSKYLVQNASFNLKTEELDGNLNFSGDLRDILEATKLYDIQAIAALLGQYSYIKASEVQPKSVGKPNAPLSEQINLLSAISSQIGKQANTITAGQIPTELDIQGKYSGEINAGGSLKNPQVDLKVSGQNWQWLPNPIYRNIVTNLGVITQETGAIAIDEVKLVGNLNGNVVQVEPAFIQLGETVLSLAAQVSPTTTTGEFKVQDLTLDLLENFVKLPLDAKGTINVTGTLEGSPQNPVVQGDIAVQNVALNGKLLENDIKSTFNYSNEKLDFATTEPEYIDIKANVPLPQEGERASVNVNLGTKAIALMDPITQGQIQLLSGEGEVKVTASVPTTDPTNLEQLELDTEILLDNATIKSAAVQDPLSVTGKILVDEKMLQVEELTGNIADSQLLVNGALPIFEPNLNPTNPLTLIIDKKQINLRGLYRGDINANVMIKGAALTPIIGGEATLANGQILIPKNNAEAQVTTTNNNQEPTPPPVDPKLENFKINLNRLNVAQLGLYRFNFNGNLVANGSIFDIENLRSEGVVRLDRGHINFLNTRFDLNRLYDNNIEFIPEDGTLNPTLDLQLETVISEVSKAGVVRDSSNSEVPDPISRVGNSDSIRVILAVDGQADQLLSFLGIVEKQASDMCKIQRDGTQVIPKPPNLSEEEFAKFADCIQFQAFAETGGADSEILNSNIVNLSSNPPRTEGEIVSLLADQLLQLAEQLQGLSSGELFESGFVQFALETVVEPIVINQVNEQTRKLGKGVGLNDFRVFPTVDAVYRIEKNQFVNLSYDYIFNEVKARYQWRF